MRKRERECLVNSHPFDHPVMDVRLIRTCNTRVSRVYVIHDGFHGLFIDVVKLSVFLHFCCFSGIDQVETDSG